MKRTIIIQDLADAVIATLNISEVQRVNIAAKLVHFSEKPDKTWKLMYSSNVFANLQDVKAFEFMNFHVGGGQMGSDTHVLLRGIGTKLNINRASPVVGKHRYIHLDHSTVSNSWNLLFHSSIIEDLTLVNRMAVHVQA